MILNTYFLLKNMVFALPKYTCTSSALRGGNVSVLLLCQISMKGKEDQKVFKTFYTSILSVLICQCFKTSIYIKLPTILTDFNYATLTSLYIFQKTVVCKIPLLR